MSVEVRQNIYAAWLDGDATSVEALRSLCADYEEIDTSYKDFERIRATVRAGRDEMRNTLLSWLPQDLTGARVLDAGCGLGDGLIALRQAYPLARLEGLEWSRPLRWLCARRCPWARVAQGDLWRADWSGYQLVYLFQRPESMPRAVEKAEAELRRGAWLVSLEFEARELIPSAILTCRDGRPVWMYQVPFNRRANGRG